MSEQVLPGVFAALGDTTRWQLLELLGAGGETSVTRLAARVPVTRQAVSAHLGVLEEAGLLVRRKVGREVRYAVRAEQVDRVAAELSARARAWDRRLGALRDVAEGLAAQRTAAGAPDEDRQGRRTGRSGPDLVAGSQAPSAPGRRAEPRGPEPIGWRA